MKRKRRAGKINAGRNAGHGKANPAKPDDSVQSLMGLFDATVSLFHRLRDVAEQVHQMGEISGGTRGVLRGLDRFGPQTVPQMARSRPVSRQHMQILVNLLARDGYVEFLENPAHKRSRLVRLTPEGKCLIEEMFKKEVRVLSVLELNINEKELKSASKVLMQVNKAFQTDIWVQILEKEKAGR